MENLENKETTILEEVFKLFTTENDLNTTFNEPFEKDNKVYATDRHCLIKIDKSLCDFSVNNKGDVPNVEAVIPVNNVNIIIDEDLSKYDIYKTEDSYDEIDEDIDCDTCDGSGEVEWEFEHYTNYFDCPVCEGSGYKEHVKKVLLEEKHIL
jgi:DnaJ-class molecular chaperone